MAKKSQCKKLGKKLEKNFQKNLNPRFRWDKEEGIHNLIQCMLIFKSQMEFEGKDVNADKYMKQRFMYMSYQVLDHQPSKDIPLWEEIIIL